MQNSVDSGTQTISPDEMPVVNGEWKNPPKLGDLTTQLREALIPHQEHYLRILDWIEAMECSGKHKPKTAKNRSAIAPKTIRKHAEWRYPSLAEPFLSSPDLFNVDPVGAEDVFAAKQNGLLLNNQFNTDIDKQAFIDDYVRTAVDEGTVIVRTGWDYQENTKRIETPTFNYETPSEPEQVERIQNLLTLYQEKPDLVLNEVAEHWLEALHITMESGTIVVPVEGEPAITEEVTVVANKPTVEICDFDSVIVDPNCKGNYKKAKFVIHRYKSDLSSLRTKGIYKNLDKVAQLHLMEGPDDTFTDSAANNQVKYADAASKEVDVYEYWGLWDIDGTGITRPVVITWVEQICIQSDLNPFHDQKPPFTLVKYLPKRKSPYGEPDGELLQDTQKLTGAFMRGIVDLLGRSANSQTGTRKGLLDPINKRRFQSGQDYEFNQIAHPADGIHTHKYPEIPQSALIMLQTLSDEADSLTGVKAFSSGLNSGSLGDVATGVRGVLDAASKRELNISRRLAAGIIEIGRKIIALNHQFLDEARVVRVTEQEFVHVDPEDLAGNFDLKLTVSTMEEDNARAEEIAFMLQTQGSLLPFPVLQMLLSELMRLRKLPHLAKMIEEYEPEPDPHQEAMDQLEQQKLQAEIEDIKAKAAERYANAEYLLSRKDMADLDFIEQESGVKHARDVDRISSQAEAQARAKLATNRSDLRGKLALESIKQQIDRNTQKTSDK